MNQGATCILTTVELAARLGIAPAKQVFLHGYAAAADRLVSERQDLSRSVAIEAALAHALKAADRAVHEIDLFDLCSCFTYAVLLAAEALGPDLRRVPATVTGGLPFFGGAGNNYSMHAIATMAERLRSAPDRFGLVLANGGFLSKQAVGIYSAMPKPDWEPVSSAPIQQAIDAVGAPPLDHQSDTAVVETFTVTYRKGEPVQACTVGRAPNGRVLARTRPGDRAAVARFEAGEPIGQPVAIEREGNANFLI